MYTITGVSKRFGVVAALRPLDLDIEPGQTTVLIGPSGCGKSTILRLMTGLLWPDEGTVLFDGVHLRPCNAGQLRRRMGYVIQDGGLFPHLTAEANMTLMARHIGVTRSAIDARLTELLELTQLSRGLLGRYPAELSGGQRQRVSLVRALMLEPDCLLLDEPLGALDPMIRRDLQNDLKLIFQRLHKTVVMVTHDIGEAGFLGDLIVLLRAGEMVQQGKLEELVNRPASAFVERFINAQRSPLQTLSREP